VLHTYRTRPHGEALALVTSLMTRWPQSPALLGCAGSLCLQMNDPAAAIEMLEQAMLWRRKTATIPTTLAWR
jgi:predicted Zn-dependent protease